VAELAKEAAAPEPAPAPAVEPVTGELAAPLVAGLGAPVGVRALPPVDPRLRRAWAHGLQRSAGNAALARAIQRQPPTQAPPDQAAPPDHARALGDVQGHAMFNLLPMLERLDPAVLADEAAAQAVGGPRLVVAIHAVKSKGNWKAFSEANADQLNQLPVDQIGDIMRYLGAPADVKVYDRGEFEGAFAGRFDGMVDPSTGTLTLIFRVSFEKVEGAQYGGVRPGEKGFDDVNQAAFDEFVAKFKTAIESVWSSKASITATCPGFKVPTFLTKVNVVVNSGQPHVTFKVYGVTSGIQSNVEKDGKTGALQVGDVEKHKTEQNLPGGKKLTSEQITAAHEFGHAIGLQHVACDGERQICYGTTDAEFGDIMGGGMNVQSLSTTSVRRRPHDDLAPFEEIARRWGKDVFPPALQAKCNKWNRA
jgi:hypothetical protein